MQLQLLCVLCSIQYVGKSETSFNIKLNNHWKDISNLKAITACIRFRKDGHNFIQHAKFTLIEPLTQTKSVIRATLKRRLKLRMIFG